MSGHSKWHSIKHQKAATDAKRGKIFTKLAGEIAIAARDGADPKMNYKLRLALTRAKQNSMPTANIDRAIARGTGTSGGASLEELTYEGYGPSGVAVIIKTVTDNRNRTASDVKSALTKFGGSLGAPGSVSYMFEQKGVILTKASTAADELSLAAIDAGATDIDDSAAQLIIYTKPSDLERVREVIGEDNVQSSELELIASQKVRIEDPAKARSVLKLIDALDDIDDVTSVDANFDIPDLLLAQIET